MFPCPTALLRQSLAAAGRRTNIHWPCCRWYRAAGSHVRDNKDPHRHPGSQTQFHAKAMLRTWRGRSAEHERDLKLRMQVPAATPANASGSQSGDSGLFCAAMSRPAARDTLLGRSTPLADYFFAGRRQFSLDLDQGHYRWPHKDFILPQSARIDRTLVLGP